LRQDGGDQGGKTRIDEQIAVVGVVDDEFDLLAEQARIDRVQHEAGARHGKVQFEMAMIVPRQGRHAIAGPEPQPRQGMGQLVHPHRALGIAVAVQARILIARHDDLFAVITCGMVEDIGDEQRRIHHQAQHGV